jgi:hypothetical protein
LLVDGINFPEIPPKYFGIISKSRIGMQGNKRLAVLWNADTTAGSFYSSVYFPKRKEDSGSRSTPINLRK